MLLFGRTDPLSQIAGAWRRRQRTFLEHKSWKSVLATDALTSQTSYNRLISILASMPGLLEDNDRIKAVQANQAAMFPNDQYEAVAYSERLTEMVGELFLWRWDWERMNPKAASEISVDPAKSISVDESGTPLYPTIISYCGIQQGLQSLLYNTTLLLVLELANDWNVQDAPLLALSKMPNQDRPLSSNPLTLPHEALSHTEVLSEICRSMEYCLQEPHTAIGAASIMYPLRALLSFSRMSRDMRWLSCITKKVANLCGLQFTFLSDAPGLLAENSRTIGGSSIPSSTLPG